MSKKDYKIACFIINYNGLEDTLHSISSVLDQTHAVDIFLLDNNSNNNEGFFLIEQYFSEERVHVYLSQTNKGFAGGCNFLFEMSKTMGSWDYIALLNNDAFAAKNWIEQLLKCSLEASAPLIASKMIQKNNQHLIDNVGHFMLNTGDIMPLGFNDPAENYNKRMEVLGACGGACLIKVKLIEEIGFFDEYFFVGYEDAEFGLRAVVRGFKCVYEPKAIVYHKMSTSIKKIFDFDYVVNLQRGIFYTYFKNLPFAFLLWNFPTFLFKTLVLILVDIVFFRWNYLKIYTKALWLFLANDFIDLAIIRKRDHHYSHISSWEMQKKTLFFLWFDLKRFWKFVILRKPSSFDNGR